MNYRTHKYMGQAIYPCEAASGEHRGRWIIQSHHSSGMPYADQHCAHYNTIADAKESIRIEAAQPRP